MLRLVIGWVVVIATVYGIPLQLNCGKRSVNLPDWRIVGGQDAVVGEFPWFSMISLLVTNPKYPQSNDFCGGTIINDRWILTAAHCVFMESQPLKVRLGVHNMSKHEPSEVDFKVEKIIIHEKWDPATISNDIALLKINESIDFGKHKQLTTICLAKSDTKLTKKCVLCGFGNVNPKSFEHPKNGILKKLYQTVADQAVCKKSYPGLYNETIEICVKDKEGHSGCQADSGGPLQCEGDDGRWYQVGIVSYGSSPCGGPNGTDVYAKVSAYVNWIEKTIANY